MLNSGSGDTSGNCGKQGWLLHFEYLVQEQYQHHMVLIKCSNAVVQKGLQGTPSQLPEWEVPTLQMWSGPARGPKALSARFCNILVLMQTGIII